MDKLVVGRGRNAMTRCSLEYPDQMIVMVDAVGIRGHGGAAVLCELLHWLPVARPEWKWHVFLFDRALREFDDPPVPPSVAIHHIKDGNTPLQRLRWVNRDVPAHARRLSANVLFSFANIAPFVAPVPQVVFCHQPNAFFDDGVPWWMMVKRAKFRALRWFILKGVRASRAVLVQTDAMRRRIEQIAPDVASRLRVIPSGFRTVPDAPVVRDHVRIAIAKANRPLMIYVSHPSEHKNHVGLIRAIPLIRNRFPGVTLALTLDPSSASNPARNRPRLKAITAATERMGVRQSLLMLGELTPDEVDFCLRASDVMVFPSMAESFGLGMVEAMAAGCPVAASNLPYAHDVLGDAAVFFDPKDPSSIASEIVALLMDDLRREALLRRAASRTNTYSYGTIGKAICEQLEAAARAGS